MSGAHIDTIAVCGVCLADLLRPIITQEQMRNGRAEHGESNTGGRIHTSGAFDVLAREAGISKRRLWGILNCELATVGLRIADDLLVALDRPDLLQSLEIFARVRGRSLGMAGSHVCSGVENGRGASVETTSLSTPGVGLAGPRPGREPLAA